MSDQAEKSRAIGRLLGGFPTLAITHATVDSYLAAVDGASLSAVMYACQNWSKRERVNPAFPPSATELAAVAETFDAMVASVEERRARSAIPSPDGYPRIGGGAIAVPSGMAMPAGYEPAGIVSMDWGHGRIDMRHMTAKQRDWVIHHRRLPATAEEVEAFERHGPALLPHQKPIHAPEMRRIGR